VVKMETVNNETDEYVHDTEGFDFETLKSFVGASDSYTPMEYNPDIERRSISE